jgi:flagellar protein FlaJ
MNRDMVLEAIEQRRGKSILQRFINSPLRTIREQRSLLYLISAVGAVSCAAVAFYMGVDLMNIGILAFIVAIMPPSFLNFYETRRTGRLEAEYPALIRDISLSVKSGMTLEGALSIAAEGQYGALTPAIKKIDNMVSWGVSFEKLCFTSPRNTPHCLSEERSLP